MARLTPARALPFPRSGLFVCLKQTHNGVCPLRALLQKQSALGYESLFSTASYYRCYCRSHCGFQVLRGGVVGLRAALTGLTLPV